MTGRLITEVILVLAGASFESTIEDTIPATLIINDISVVLDSVMILTGDLLISWRAWVLLPHDTFWRFVLATITIGDIGINIADGIFDIFCMMAMLDGSPPFLDLVALGFSLVVNLTATALIGWKAWVHHQAMRDAAMGKKSGVQKILLLFVESGAFFLILQLFTWISMRIFTLVPLGQPSALLSTISSNLWYTSAGLYPIAMIILIHSENSPITETFHFTSQLAPLNVP
ncbi:hypothetical protein BDP27DRAFT_1426660 [Rhodocollybia butyracea]|uniref:Uncharacterized protein n=1 Tax=Rhodocollybia butyracea TaxID=206335 RepID=A0A9P5U1H0_9AGAR|nr:hypothetical protein BDP27DRAFT_1426660 [Rhodocollybia butyracea]